MLPAAACAAALPDHRSLARLFTLAVYGFGSAICHQRADRSFHLLAVQLPVCARCTGLYAGAAAAALSYVWLSRQSFRRGPAEAGRHVSESEAGRHVSVSGARRDAAARATRTARLLLAAAALPMAASIVYEWTTGDVPSNAVRAATGFVLGSAVAQVILAALDSTR
jgi:uncharacterized membrane protein